MRHRVSMRLVGLELGTSNQLELGDTVSSCDFLNFCLSVFVLRSNSLKIQFAIKYILKESFQKLHLKVS